MNRRTTKLHVTLVAALVSASTSAMAQRWSIVDARELSADDAQSRVSTDAKTPALRSTGFFASAQVGYGLTSYEEYGVGDQWTSTPGFTLEAGALLGPRWAISGAYSQLFIGGTRTDQYDPYPLTDDLGYDYGEFGGRGREFDISASLLTATIRAYPWVDLGAYFLVGLGASRLSLEYSDGSQHDRLGLGGRLGAGYEWLTLPHLGLGALASTTYARASSSNTATSVALSLTASFQ